MTQDGSPSERELGIERWYEAGERPHDVPRVARLGTLGDLAASLAHELNQPLAAVMANAQTAVRILASDSPRLDELRAILADIVEDDRRAGEIVRRLQAMVGEMEAALQPADGAAPHITPPATDERPPTHTP